MNKKMIYPIFFVLIMLGLSLNMPLAAAKPIKIKYAHLGPPKPFDSAIHAASVSFKYVMEKRSSGKFQIEIYPSGTLGKEIDMMEAVKKNVIQVHGASAGGLIRIFPAALVPFSPFVFRNEAIAVEVLDGPYGQMLLDGFTKKTGIKGLCIVDLYSFKSRYITEDLPYGLVPIKKLAQQYDVSTPLIDAVIEFGSVINQTD